MDEVRVQPGFGKKQCRLSSIVVPRRKEMDQQRHCKYQQPRGHPSSGADSGLAIAFSRMTGDLGKLSQVLPNLDNSTPNLRSASRQRGFPHRGTAQELWPSPTPSPVSFSTSCTLPPLALLIHCAHLLAPTLFDLQGCRGASWPPAQEGAPASWRMRGFRGVSWAERGLGLGYVQ